MSTSVVIGGLTYYVPAVGESNWGQNVSDALIALAANISGSAFFTIVSVSSSPITVVSGRTYLVNTGAARQLNLPTPATGAYLMVKDVTGTASAYNITINRNGGEKIDGVAANKTLAVNSGIWWFVSDGTDWFTLLNPQIRAKQRITTTERDAITNWVEGDEIYNLTLHRSQEYNGITWR